MELKLLLTFSTFLAFAYGQSIRCDFRVSGVSYFCDLNIDNPTGFDGFTRIEGTHLEGFTDSDVINVRTFGRSANVPRIICETFPNLVHFAFNNVSATFISDYAYASCFNVDTIHFTHNLISQIGPNVFRNNRNLRVLWLIRTELIALPSTLLINNPRLEQFFIFQNRLTHLPVNIFQGNPLLARVSISSNEISVWHPEWFQDKPNMSLVDFNNNRLTLIPPNVLHPNNILREFRINNNQIREIRMSSFGNTNSWVVFTASDNLIEFIDREVLEASERLGTVTLLNNVCANHEWPINFNRNCEQNLAQISACFH